MPKRTIYFFIIVVLAVIFLQYLFSLVGVYKSKPVLSPIPIGKSGPTTKPATQPSDPCDKNNDGRCDEDCMARMGRHGSCLTVCGPDYAPCVPDNSGITFCLKKSHDATCGAGGRGASCFGTDCRNIPGASCQITDEENGIYGCACENSNEEICNDRCVNIQTDNQHCGRCYHECYGGKICVNGQCQCPEGQTYCIYECVDTGTDPNNCGSCGNNCVLITGMGSICVNGQCQCPSGLTSCGSVIKSCVDLQNDRFNCGACGNICSLHKTCQQGSCVCEQGYTDCEGICKDLQNDRDNCGSCGNVCGDSPGEAGECINGECQCPSDRPDICPGFRGNICTNIQNDASNCGSCGNSCSLTYGRGSVCVNGQCQCPAGRTLCNGECVNLQNDERNCGACGNSCDIVTQTCVNGHCVDDDQSSQDRQNGCPPDATYETNPGCTS
ncbi:hypothetical protein D6817_02580 [Candidatus Pacearchaeota archaeon]|nr:MAG: hypothetical protein D6817_02580 [Candidatus Pacearchaeota archaeon]